MAAIVPISTTSATTAPITLMGGVELVDADDEAHSITAVSCAAILVVVVTLFLIAHRSAANREAVMPPIRWSWAPPPMAPPSRSLVYTHPLLNLADFVQ